jgi:hypothetical protein
MLSLKKAAREPLLLNQSSGDYFLIAAGAAHRFESFSDDFCAWVVFWGPPGGEPP